MQIRLNSLFRLSGCILLCFLSSCGNYFYAPDEGHMLAIEEKGDLKISAGFGNTQSRGANYGLQAAYSPINHLAVSVNYFRINIGESDNGFSESGSGYSLNGALGGYLFIPDKKISDSPNAFFKEELRMRKGVLFDFYVGASKGMAENHYPSGGFSELEFNKYFIQTGIHWKRSNFGLQYALRGGILDYNKGLAIGRIENRDIDNINRLEQNNPFTIIESSFRFYCGTNKYKFYISNNSVLKADGLAYLDSTFLLGLIFDIHRLFRKKHTTETDTSFK